MMVLVGILALATAPEWRVHGGEPYVMIPAATQMEADSVTPIGSSIRSFVRRMAGCTRRSRHLDHVHIHATIPEGDPTPAPNAGHPTLENPTSFRSLTRWVSRLGPATRYRRRPVDEPVHVPEPDSDHRKSSIALTHEDYQHISSYFREMDWPRSDDSLERLSVEFVMSSFGAPGMLPIIIERLGLGDHSVVILLVWLSLHGRQYREFVTDALVVTMGPVVSRDRLSELVDGMVTYAGASQMEYIWVVFELSNILEQAYPDEFKRIFASLLVAKIVWLANDGSNLSLSLLSNLSEELIGMNERMAGIYFAQPAKDALIDFWDTTAIEGASDVHSEAVVLSLVALHKRVYIGDEAGHLFCATLLSRKVFVNAMLDKWPGKVREYLLTECPAVLPAVYRRLALLNNILGGDEMEVVSLNVHRNRVVEGSRAKFLFLQSIRFSLSSASFRVHFIGEEGCDQGGVTREWYSIITRTLFTGRWGAFEPTHGGIVKLAIRTNDAAGVIQREQYTWFAGAFVAKAVLDGIPLGVTFNRSLYKLILGGFGAKLDLVDYRAEDPEHSRSLEWILSNGPDTPGWETVVDDLTFAVTETRPHSHRVIELVPGGAGEVVTEENKWEYVSLVIENKMRDSIRTPLSMFLEGFYSVIPRSWLSRLQFSVEELAHLIAGDPHVDASDLKQHTVYEQPYTRESPQILWFWEVVEAFDTESASNLLKFVTGSPRTPLGGFSQLRGGMFNALSPFTIVRAGVSASDDFNSNPLPSAHTCVNQLELPAYSSKYELERKLMQAISMANEGFAFA